MKKIYTFLLSLFISLALLSTASAGSFTISGKLAGADPLTNQYSANYRLYTPEGKIYFLKLEESFYQEWIGENVFFNVIGEADYFSVYSSAVGVRKNTAPNVPKTGASSALLLMGSIFGGAYLSNKRKES